MLQQILNQNAPSIGCSTTGSTDVVELVDTIVARRWCSVQLPNPERGVDRVRRQE